jgi:hypothetical protein
MVVKDLGWNFFGMIRALSTAHIPSTSKSNDDTLPDDDDDADARHTTAMQHKKRKTARFKIIGG